MVGRRVTTSFAQLLAVSLVMTAAATVGAAAPSSAQPRDAKNREVSQDHGHWVLSRQTLPIGKDFVVGLKLPHDKVMWVGGAADDPADSNRSFIYDVRTRRFRETAPMPAAKRSDGATTAGVLHDGTVVVVGGDVENAAASTSRLSYRYDPATDTWTRTGDLPEGEEIFGTPTTTLKDGRLLLVGGIGADGLADGTASDKAFVYDVNQTSTVQVIDPDTGLPTGDTAVVQGKWDYTRSTATGQVTTLGRGHLFGNAVLLRDGRVFVVGGHKVWNYTHDDQTSVLARDTDYFDPSTGEWTTGAPLPSVAGEDDTIPGSHGGRMNGVCTAVMGDGKVVIAGGGSHTDGEAIDSNFFDRQSILVMTPARSPAHSSYRLSPNPIPPGTGHGSVFGDGGRNQLMCYPLPRNRLLIAGGQDSHGDDLYDTYVFDSRTWKVTPGPLMAHGKPIWAAQHPEWGYPADYETSVISTRDVGMNDSKLVFGDTFVHGGAYSGVGDDNFFGSRLVEQLTFRE